MTILPVSDVILSVRLTKPEAEKLDKGREKSVKVKTAGGRDRCPNRTEFIRYLIHREYCKLYDDGRKVALQEFVTDFRNGRPKVQAELFTAAEVKAVPPLPAKGKSAPSALRTKRAARGAKGGRKA